MSGGTVLGSAGSEPHQDDRYGQPLAQVDDAYSALERFHEVVVAIRRAIGIGYNQVPDPTIRIDSGFLNDLDAAVKRLWDSSPSDIVMGILLARKAGIEWDAMQSLGRWPTRLELLLAIALLGCAATAAAEDGRVVDHSGVPVAHVRVDCGDHVTYSDEHGRFGFGSSGAVVLPSERGFGPEGLVLRGRRKLTGRITTTQPDRLVVHLDLARPVDVWRREYVESVRRLEVASGEAFAFVSLRPASYRVRVESVAHQHLWRSISLVGGDGELVVHLEPGVLVEGAVRFDLSSRKALPPVLRVEAGGRTTLVDASGHFAFPGFYPGVRTFSVQWSEPDTPPGAWANERFFDLDLAPPRAAATLVVRDIQPVRIRYHLPDGSPPVVAQLEVRGSRPMAAYRNPLEFRVERTGDGETVVTPRIDRLGRPIADAQRGQFVVLEDLADGPYRFVTTAAGYRAEAPLIDARKTPLLSIALDAVPGRPVVFDGESGSVAIRGPGGAQVLTPTDRHGFLAAGSNRLEWTSDKYLPHVEELRVAGNEPLLHLDFEKVPAPVLRSVITTADGIPSSGHVVQVAPPDWIERLAVSGVRVPTERMRAVVADKQRFEIRGLPPGPYGVMVDGVRLPDFRLVDGENDVTLRLPD